MTLNLTTVRNFVNPQNLKRAAALGGAALAGAVAITVAPSPASANRVISQAPFCQIVDKATTRANQGVRPGEILIKSLDANAGGCARQAKPGSTVVRSGDALTPNISYYVIK